MEKEGFLLMVEEVEDTLELWDSWTVLSVPAWPVSNLPLQLSLLTEALRLSVLPPPGVLELILTEITVEAGKVVQWSLVQSAHLQTRQNPRLSRKEKKRPEPSTSKVKGDTKSSRE